MLHVVLIVANKDICLKKIDAYGSLILDYEWVIFSFIFFFYTKSITAFSKFTRFSKLQVEL